MTATHKIAKIYPFKIFLLRVSFFNYFLLSIVAYIFRAVNGINDVDLFIILCLTTPPFFRNIISNIKFLKKRKQKQKYFSKELIEIAKKLLISLGISNFLVICLIAFNVAEFSNRGFSYSILLFLVSIYEGIVELIISENGFTLD